MKGKKQIQVWIVLFFFLGTSSLIKGEEKIQYPSIVARSGIVMDLDSGRVLWEKDAYKKRAIASTTKIMTCILALEKGNLQDEVKVSARAAAAPRVKLYIKPGEVYRLEDLLYALMLRSSNDVAVAIAEHIGGSVEEFCNMMTQKAKEIGAINTSYKTPNGLDAEDHYSTAYDLALITAYALKNPTFAKIITTREITIPKSGGSYRSFYLSNANRFLADYEGATGVKTGFTSQAGYCFVGSAKRDNMHLISVVLGSGWYPQRNQKWIDTKAIMDYGFTNFKPEKIIHQGTQVSTIPITYGLVEEVGVGYTENFIYPLKKEDEITTRLYLPTILEAPIIEGTVVGYAKVFLNGEECKQIELKTLSTVERHDFFTSFQKLIKNWMEMQGISSILS